VGRLGSVVRILIVSEVVELVVRQCHRRRGGTGRGSSGRQGGREVRLFLDLARLEVPGEVASLQEGYVAPVTDLVLCSIVNTLMLRESRKFHGLQVAALGAITMVQILAQCLLLTRWAPVWIRTLTG